MRGDMVSELRLAALYANQVARAIVRMNDRRAIVRMDDRLSFFFNATRSNHNTFAIQYLCDRPVDHDRRIGHPWSMVSRVVHMPSLVDEQLLIYFLSKGLMSKINHYQAIIVVFNLKPCGPEEDNLLLQYFAL